MRDISKNIREVRLRRGMSQEQLAQALHVTRQTVSNYETGRSRPDVETLTLLAQALEADVRELLYGPAVSPRRRSVRRLLVAAAITAAVGVVWALLGVVAGMSAYRYILVPYYLLRTGPQALLFLLLGWTGAQACVAALGSSPLEGKWPVRLRRTVLALLGVYAVVMLPFWIWCIGDTYQVWIRHSQDLDYTYSSSFHIFPLWDQAVTALAWWAMGHPWVFALPGAALCILGFPRQQAEQPEPEPQTENVDSPK